MVAWPEIPAASPGSRIQVMSRRQWTHNPARDTCCTTFCQYLLKYAFAAPASSCCSFALWLASHLSAAHMGTPRCPAPHFLIRFSPAYPATPCVHCIRSHTNPAAVCCCMYHSPPSLTKCCSNATHRPCAMIGAANVKGAPFMGGFPWVCQEVAHQTMRSRGSWTGVGSQEAKCVLKHTATEKSG